MKVIRFEVCDKDENEYLDFFVDGKCDDSIGYLQIKNKMYGFDRKNLMNICKEILNEL